VALDLPTASRIPPLQKPCSPFCSATPCGATCLPRRRSCSSGR
jgi:hypothetical protein